MVESSRTSQQVVVQMGRKIRNEMEEICSRGHDSILRDSNEAVKRFSWETVWLELLNKMPTLMNLLGCLISDPKESKPLLCLIVSMLLKKRLRNMCLVQRALSVLLYGNGISKQVSYSLLCICTCILSRCLLVNNATI